MNPSRLVVSFAAVGSAALATEPEPAHRIEILADVPSVAVAPRQPGRFTMRLPSLTYALTMIADCDEAWRPDSASISVADSSRSFGAEQLQTGESLRFDLEVPSNQIGPLTLEQFCVSQPQANAEVRTRITIRSVLSAQASLSCATDSQQSIRYVSVPLDVSLECIVPELVDDE